MKYLIFTAIFLCASLSRAGRADLVSVTLGFNNQPAQYGLTELFSGNAATEVVPSPISGSIDAQVDVNPVTLAISSIEILGGSFSMTDVNVNVFPGTTPFNPALNFVTNGLGGVFAPTTIPVAGGNFDASSLILAMNTGSAAGSDNFGNGGVTFTGSGLVLNGSQITPLTANGITGGNATVAATAVGPNFQIDLTLPFLGTFQADGVVGQAVFPAMRSTVSGTITSSAVTAVPEPNSFLLLAIVGAVACGWKKFCGSQDGNAPASVG